MTPTVYADLEQGSPEWFAMRAGKPTASAADRILTPVKGAPSKQADAYINELIAERAMGGPPVNVESFASRPMRDGIDMEPDARRRYELVEGVDVQRVGGVLSACGRFWVSPDGLIGEDGMLELKCPLLTTHISHLRMEPRGLPTDYRLQCHAALWIAGREWLDLVSYAPGRWPLFIVRVVPDEFTAQVGKAMQEFSDRYESEWDRVEAMRPAPVNEAAMSHPF